MLFRKCKRIALLLVVSLILSVVGTSSVYAEEKEEEPTCEYYGPRDGVEVEELRTETAKQYLLPDGTMQYIASPDRIHWKDEDGTYIDIDNSIIDTEYDIDGLLYTHSNKSSDIKMFFADSNQVNEYPIRIEYQGYGLSYGIDGADISLIPVEEAIFPEILTENVCLDNAVMYQTDQGFDLVYIPKNSGEKEYIIIQEPIETNNFVFRLRLEGLVPKQTERGVVLLNNEGNPIFDIGGLFAVDSNEVYCDEAEATLLEYNGETATIRIEVSQEWMEEESRIYPVVIDPTSMVCGEFVTYDSYISSVDTNVHFYLYDHLRMGKDDDYGIRRTAIQFELPSILSYSVISACINIRLYSYDGSLSTLYGTPITSSWTSAGICWNLQPSYNTSYHMSHAQVDTWHDTSNWYTFPFTSLVVQWLAGTTTNYGVMLFDSIENNTGHWSTFYSSDYGYPNRPELMINYTASTSYSNKADLIGITIGPITSGLDHYSFLAPTSSSLSGIGYNVSSNYSSYSNTGLSNILTGGGYSVFVIKAHCEPVGTTGLSKLLINDSGYTWYSSQNVLNMSSTALGGYQLMVFLSCESAKDYSMGKNIVAACRAKGAACVVGFTAKIDTDSSTDWVERMFDYLSQGFSISYACHQALLDGDYDYEDNIWSYLPKGSANQPLFIFN